jgi:hypothetical protein
MAIASASQWTFHRWEIICFLLFLPTRCNGCGVGSPFRGFADKPIRAATSATGSSQMF